MSETQTQTKTATTRKSKAPAQPTPEKATAAKTAPAKAAPAKKAAPAATAPAARKLRWVVAEGQERSQAGGKNQTAESEGHGYAIERAGEQWRTSHTYEGKTGVLVEGKFAACYRAAVEHNRNR